MHRARAVALAACLVYAAGTQSGCGGGVESRTIAGEVRDPKTGAPIAGAVVSLGRVEVRTDDAGKFEVSAEVTRGARVEARAPGRCPDSRLIDASTGRAPFRLHLPPRIEVEGGGAQVGFDTEVTLRVKTRCDPSASLRWRQTTGPTIEAARIVSTGGGRVYRVRTHKIDELQALSTRLGAVAFDRRARGDYRFEVALEGARAEEVGARVEVRLTAAPLAIGVYQAATGADFYLNGGHGAAHAWSLVEKPERSRAALVDPHSRTPHFRPDRFGQYLVRHDTSGLEINIQAGPYEDVPRDCGREGCHVAEDQGWRTTAHARAFQRGVSGELGPAFDVRCWGCHATGVDWGVENGGLHATAAHLGWTQPTPGPGVLEGAPRQVRRQGSVWCSACHGPGRILPPQFHWEYGAKYSAQVCARCHGSEAGDPEVPHPLHYTADFARAPMSRFTRALSEDDPALREGCAQCHGTQPFIEWRRRDRFVAGERETVEPIACSVCHDAHDGSRAHGLRVVGDAPLAIGGSAAGGLGTGAMCTTCHRADAMDGVPREISARALGGGVAAPHAPQSEVLLGRGARTVRGHERNVHAAAPDSCATCHMAQVDESDPLRGRMGSHTFAARDLGGHSGERGALSPYACRGCHQESAAEIGARTDWDGDGAPGVVQEEIGRAIARARVRLEGEIARLHVRDACAVAREAASFGEHDAVLLLRAADGKWLGDCDGDGRFGEGERAVSLTRVPVLLRDRIYDLMLIEKDGSRGLHNPGFVRMVVERIVR